jgi:hypothetical protein
MLETDSLEAIEAFAFEKSSISAIHYYGKQKRTQKLNGGDDDGGGSSVGGVGGVGVGGRVGGGGGTDGGESKEGTAASTSKSGSSSSVSSSVSSSTVVGTVGSDDIYSASVEDIGDNGGADCPLHSDSGILTVGVASDVCGLEIQDRATGEYVPVEALARPNDLVIFNGLKLEMLSHDPGLNGAGSSGAGRRGAGRGGSTFMATPHLVNIDCEDGGERHSTVFLLDIAK